MDLVEKFIEELRLQNKSVHTQENYRRDLTEFVNFLQVIPPAWKEVTARQVKDFVMQQVRAEKSSSTVARSLSALRSFYQYLIRLDLVSVNPAKGVRPPKQAKPLPKALDIDATQQLLDQSLETWQDYRDQAMFELLYSSGVRVAELASLDISPGLDGLANGTIQVLGKGNKMRLAMVGAKAQEALQEWLAKRAEVVKADETAVFINQRGTRLSIRSIQLRLDKRATLAGLDTKMSPHRLRHAFASHMLQSSGDLRAVQEMLGHANLSTTQIYTQLDLQKLASVYDAAHPRARKK